MKLAGKRDILIIGAALALCIAGALLFVHPGGSMVRVYVGDELYEEAPLYVDRVITINQDGCENRVTIGGGSVYMSFSTCKNQDCVHQGKMTPDNIASRALSNWIVCLPNRVTVELTEE